MQIFFLIVISLAVGYSAGVSRKSTKDDDTIAGLLVELEEKSAYFREVSSYLQQEDEGLDYIRNYLERNRASDEDAEIAARNLERIMESIDEAGRMQFVTDEARERIRNTVRTEKKKPLASRAFNRIKKWL